MDDNNEKYQCKTPYFEGFWTTENRDGSPITFKDEYYFCTLALLICFNYVTGRDFDCCLSKLSFFGVNETGTNLTWKLNIGGLQLG